MRFCEWLLGSITHGIRNKEFRNMDSLDIDSSNINRIDEEWRDSRHKNKWHEIDSRDSWCREE